MLKRIGAFLEQATRIHFWRVYRIPPLPLRQTYKFVVVGLFAGLLAEVVLLKTTQIVAGSKPPIYWFIPCSLVLFFVTRFVASNLFSLVMNSDSKAWPTFPKVWDLFSFLLPRKARQECFEPAYNDLLEDYVRAQRFRHKGEQRWITFCFLFRTALMWMDCLRVFLQSGTGRILLGLLPETFRNWWRRQ